MSLINSKHPYRENYFGHVLILIILALAGIVLIGWIIFSYFEWSPTSTDSLITTLAEPMIILLVAITALIAGQRFSNQLGELRSRELPQELETLEDHTFEPWRAVNHSFHHIEWTTRFSQRTRKHIERFCIAQNIPGRWMKIKLFIKLNEVERLIEDTGTDNNRVIGWFKCYYVRIYKSITKPQLDMVDSIAKYLRDEKLFDEDSLTDDSYPKTQVALDLLPPDRKTEVDYHINGNRIFFPSGTIKDEPAIVQVFPYAMARYQFQGKNISEIGSFARKLRLVQESLASVPDEMRAEIIKAQQSRTVGSEEASARSIEKRFGIVESKLRTPGLPDLLPEFDNQKIDKLFNEQRDVLADLKGSLKYVADLRRSYKRDTVLMHDIHPHNVLFEDVDSTSSARECLLIHDYGWVGLWNHNVVTAFAMHRFIREYIRQLSPLDGDFRPASCGGLYRHASEHLHSNILAGIEQFRHGYGISPRPEVPLENSDNKLTLSENFWRDLDNYILCRNTEKLLNSLEWITGTPDPFMRSPNRLMGELCKFVRFFYEAKEFRDALENSRFLDQDLGTK